MDSFNETFSRQRLSGSTQISRKSGKRWQQFLTSELPSCHFSYLFTATDLRANFKIPLFRPEKAVPTGGLLGVFQLGMRLKSLSEYALHLTFLPQPGPLPVNKRKGSASEARQSAQLPSPAGRGFLLEQGAGAVRSLLFPHCCA